MKGRRCTQQRRELVQAGALDTRENLKDRVARLEAIIQASGIDSTSFNTVQTSSHFGAGSRDGKSDEIRSESSPSSMNGNPTHVSTVSSLETSDLLSTSTSADIDPIVTLFDNAIVSHMIYYSPQGSNS